MAVPQVHEEIRLVQLLSALRAGSSDVLGSAGSWRVWWMLARNDIFRRYRRSRLGPFWLSLSTGAMVVGLGLVYSTIFRTDIQTYLPFLAASLVFWTFMATTVTESCGAFSDADDIIKQIDLPRYIFIQRVVLRNLIILAHNTVIIPLTMLALLFSPGDYSFLSLAGIAITVANLSWIGTLVALVSIRFRDVPMIIQNIMQLGFFITPVMFRPTQLPEHHPLVTFNPFAVLLDLMRGPLLGTVPPLSSYLTMTLLALVGWIIALIAVGLFGRRVIYWL